MYGEELDVFQSDSRGLFMKMGTHGIIIKDVWAYAAGFLDADGSIFISERGEPRATLLQLVKEVRHSVKVYTKH